MSGNKRICNLSRLTDIIGLHLLLFDGGMHADLNDFEYLYRKFILKRSMQFDEREIGKDESVQIRLDSFQ